MKTYNYKGGYRMERKFTLKQWRNIAGLSQAELAEAVGRDVSTIVRWEKEEGAQPRATDIAKIEKALNIEWSRDVLVQ